jgi:hypothetical protein
MPHVPNPTQCLPLQVSPVGHVPQNPPQPFEPHVLPAQFGTHGLGGGGSGCAFAGGLPFFFFFFFFFFFLPAAASRNVLGSSVASTVAARALSPARTMPRREVRPSARRTKSSNRSASTSALSRRHHRLGPVGFSRHNAWRPRPGNRSVLPRHEKT